MASSITLKSNSYDGRYLQLTCTQEKDTANNKSIIHWTLSSIGGSSNYYSTGPTYISINDEIVYYIGRVNWDAKVFPAAKGSVSGTVDVEHDDDGSKTISVWFATAIYYSTINEYGTGWELDPIPRGATITSAPSTFSNTSLPTINYTNPLGNQVSKLEVCIADSVGYYALAPYRDLSKTGSSYTFTDDDMKALNAKFGSKDKKLGVMFVIKTTTADGKVYSDGETSTYEMVATDDTKPSVSVACTVINPDTFPSALASTYVQGKSKAKVKVTASGKYKATITNFTLSVDGQNHMSIGFSEKENDYTTFTTGVITSKDKVVVTGGASDSRGFQGKAEQSITVGEYSKPTVVNIGSETAIFCHRSNEEGKRVGNSTSVWVKAKRSYYDFDGKNLCMLQWRRKPSSNPWDDNTHKWADLIASTAPKNAEYNGFLKDADGNNIVFEGRESYSVQIKAVDDVGEYDIKDFEIPTLDVALHLGAGGKKVSIGEYCDEDMGDYTFRSSWKAKFENGIYGTLNGTVNGTMSQELAGDVLAFAEACPQGFTPFFTGGSSTNVPTTGNYQYASGFVHKRSDSQITVFIISYYTGDLAINTYYDTAGGWLGWRYLHTTTT